MANIPFYEKLLGKNNVTVDDICQRLLNTFLETNYTASFFVNWEKAIDNRDNYKVEIALLQSLHRSKNIKADFRALIGKYPETIKALPCMLALRECTIKLIFLLGVEIRYQTIDFDREYFSPEDMNNITDFAEASGLLEMITATGSFADYVLGVEVGLDSNARKNRSGFFLETMVEGIIESLGITNEEFRLVKQVHFKTLNKDYGIPLAAEVLDSKADFAIVYHKKILNIEVNFYSGSGSKPSEIVNSYANRNRLLKSTGCAFVWLTDGPGWNKMHNPLKLGVSQIDYVFNVDLLRHGALQSLLTTLD
jgi:type II restriction enzyme